MATELNMDAARAAAQAFEEGSAALDAGHLDKAETAFRRAGDLEPSHMEAQFQLGRLLAKMLRMEEAEPYLQRVREARPASAPAHHAHGVALGVLGRRDEAEAAFRRALEIHPGWTVAEKDLADLNAAPGGGGVDKRKLARWPILMSEFADLRDMARRHVVADAGEAGFTIGPTTRVFTLGSCFAQNLAEALSKTGTPTAHFPYVEDINSTFANRYLLEWLLGRLKTGPTAGYFDAKYGAPMRDELRVALEQADVIIFTVGVAPCFFERESGAFVLPRASSVSLWAQDNIFRTTTVEENKDNILAIIEAAKSLNADVKIVLTVSPVPLKATLEMASVVQADCISKSTLRVAVHEVMGQGIDGVVYWPSFEIARWLSAYFPATFGADDGRSRHVSKAVIEVILELFLERYGA
jgi:tetratricopeptide (TPR) repeat protein